MIYTISGKLTYKEDDALVVQVGGLGLLVSCPLPLIERAKIGSTINLFCFFHAEQFQLFGFVKKEELDLFELLLLVSGVGPRSAMKIMSAHSSADIRTMIALDQAQELAQGAGIGQKTAARIILELRGKVQAVASALRGKDDHEAVAEALKVLGYAKKDIAYALDHIPSSAKRLEEKVRGALQALAKHHA